MVDQKIGAFSNLSGGNDSTCNDYADFQIIKWRGTHAKRVNDCRIEPSDAEKRLFENR